MVLPWAIYIIFLFQEAIMSKELFSSFKNTPEVFIQESARIGDQFITVSVPLDDLDARCILLPCGVSIGIQDDTTPVEPVTEEAKAVEMLAGAMVADLVMDSYPAVLLHKRVE